MAVAGAEGAGIAGGAHERAAQCRDRLAAAGRGTDVIPGALLFAHEIPCQRREGDLRRIWLWDFYSGWGFRPGRWRRSWTATIPISSIPAVPHRRRTCCPLTVKMGRAQRAGATLSSRSAATSLTPSW